MKKCDINNMVKFIRKIYNTNKLIPLHEPKFFGNEKKYLLECIDSTFVSSVGEFVDKFEYEMSSFMKANKVVAVVNGTSALQIALKLAGVENDNEVITQALTFVATANSILYLNSHPVFIDVDKDTMGLSPRALNHFLEEFGELRDNATYNKKTGKKIAACVPMHTFGFMCKMDEIISICKKWKIPVVEDAAEALGSKYKGKPSGTMGLISAFSFNGNKIITSGGGGAITTNNIILGNRAKHLTTTAKIKHKWEYAHDELGYNFRMPNINAALLCAQLENFSEIKSSKIKLYNHYKNWFKMKGINLVDIPNDTDWNYWLISIILDNEQDRDLFLTNTNSQGIMTRPIWKLMYKLPMYKNYYKDEQRNAEYLESRIINIPSSALL